MAAVVASTSSGDFGFGPKRAREESEAEGAGGDFLRPTGFFRAAKKFFAGSGGGP